MRPGTTRYQVEILRSGQARPHADTIDEYIITVRWNTYRRAQPDQPEKWEPRTFNDEVIPRAAQGLIGPFKQKKDKPDWHEPILTSFSNIGPGKWRFVITQAYTD